MIEKKCQISPVMSSYLKHGLCQAQIERALHDHFLFRKLTDSQCHVLLDCMQRVEVQPGDVVVRQVRFLMYSVITLCNFLLLYIFHCFWVRD